jgi:hypothetical protein
MVPAKECRAAYSLFLHCRSPKSRLSVDLVVSFRSASLLKRGNFYGLTDVTQSKDVKQGRILRSFPPLAAANLLFFCLEFILAIETRSASLFADSIAFPEGASVSVLLSSGRNWSMPGWRHLRGSPGRSFSFRSAFCFG